MTKNNLFKIIAITFLVFMLVGLVFFRKSDDEILNPNPVPADNQQVENPDEKYKLTEEEKLKIFAENFVITYYSYTWGNFSNVESQYCHMTDEMKSREEIKVEKMKREIKGQPQRYFTVQARITNFNFAEYQEDKAISYIPGATDFHVLNEDALDSKEVDLLNKIKSDILEPYNGTGVQQVLNYATFTISNLICVYPVYDVHNYSDKSNNVLPDVFLVKKGTLLRDFVRKKIHSDLAKQFMFGIDAKTSKRLGENYELQHNDIIKIVTSK